MDIGVLSEDASVTDLREGQLDPSALAQHCVSWGVGPLKIEACINLSVPEADVTIHLAGVKIAEARLDRGHLCANLGGSVGGFKAKVKVCLALNPLRINVDAELCVPIVGCKKYHHEFHLSPHQEMEGTAAIMWQQ